MIARSARRQVQRAVDEAPAAGVLLSQPRLWVGLLSRQHPVGNTACAAAAARYRRCLTENGTFDMRTLDELVQAARLATPDPRPDEIYARYLDPNAAKLGA